MNKITSLVFMALCLCLFAGTAKAQTPTPWEIGNTYLYEGVWYKVVRANEVAVVRNPDGQDYSGTITVPGTVNSTYEVKYVATHAFGYTDGTAIEDTHIEYVNLPNTIVSFANCAFQNSKSLKKIEIPNSVVALWDDNFDGEDDGGDSGIGATFMNCPSVEEIIIGSGITTLVAANGVFNNAGMSEGYVNVKKITCRAATPPRMNGNSFIGMNPGITVLLVPEASVNAYAIADVWKYFATPEQFAAAGGGEDGGYGIGIYPVGTCLSPWNVKATNEGLITWRGDAGAYNAIISTTELDAAALAAYPSGDIIRTTDTEYDFVFDATENVINYVYLQGDCGEGTSTWASTSFFYYAGSYCEYTVSGQDIYYTVDPDDEYLDPMPWGWDGSGLLEFWQNGILIATVNGSAAFAGTTVSLMSGIPATLEWKGNYEYDDPCTLLVTDADGNTVLSRNDLVGNEPATLGPIDVNCSGDADIKKLDISSVSIASTLSSGFVTVNAETGSVVKIMDLMGRLLKQEPITRANQKVELNYANGVYLIMLENGNHTRLVQKVILKK